MLFDIVVLILLTIIYLLTGSKRVKQWADRIGWELQYRKAVRKIK